MGPGHFRACPAAPPPPAPRRPGEGGGSRAGGPAAPCVHSVHGQRGRPRARLRRPVRSAAEGVPRSRLRHQLHPGARTGALHGLARRRAAPLGRARPPVRPAAAPRRPSAQPLPPLQQQGGLCRRASAARLSAPRPPPAGRPAPGSGLCLSSVSVDS
ncbi:wiskott-Aldrich syndrome protein homolog [Ursus maritimus]|uniref:Wiskott-Aldrich syndrome protein homolog n=1 Tax=Ursus maritimus TaxID=29073 RepID=A0A8M1GVG5_URSMA|nr:wiskott-Aldrich syndrome protein homolog [Ursus maritimus]